MRWLFPSLSLLLVSGYAANVCIENMQETDIVSSFSLSCDAGQVITAITFASFGAPSGTCADNNFQSNECASIDPSGSYASLQQKVDSTVKWVLDLLCYSKQSCTWQGYITAGNTTADMLFGDPCPHKTKTLSVLATCGPMPAPQTTSAAPIWTTDSALNMMNFKSTNQLVTLMYDVVDGNTPYETLTQGFPNLQLDFTPTAQTPFRFVPLITFEKQFSIAYTDMTTAWFGIMARLLNIDGFIVIAFRGTLTTTDWIYNANIQSVPLPDSMAPVAFDASKVLVHSGFMSLYNGMRPMLMAGVQMYNPKGIIITGHSLGSSLATLAAYDLANQGYAVNSVYAFASPRVGNPYFVDMVQQTLNRVGAQFYRIANSADIVTQIPPAVLSVGGDGNTGKYMHVGGTQYAYEYIPEDDNVLGDSIVNFVLWAHNLNTYLEYAPQYLTIANSMLAEE